MHQADNPQGAGVQRTGFEPKEEGYVKMMAGDTAQTRAAQLHHETDGSTHFTNMHGWVNSLWSSARNPCGVGEKNAIYSIQLWRSPCF